MQKMQHDKSRMKSSMQKSMYVKEEIENIIQAATFFHKNEGVSYLCTNISSNPQRVSRFHRKQKEKGDQVAGPYRP